MAQRELRLVVDVAVAGALASFVVKAVYGVEAIGAFVAHDIADTLPSFHLQAAVGFVALVVFLRCAHAGERDFVTVVDALRHVEEPVVSAVGCALDVAVAPAVRSEDGDSPAVLHDACGELEAVLVHAVVAHAVPDAAASVDVERAGGDGDGAADRGCGEDACTESALCLDVAGDVAEARPVAPVDIAVLHVVDGHAVDCDGHPLALETAHASLSIAIAATLLIGVDAGGCLQDFGEFLLAELEVDGGLVDIAHGHGGDTCLTDGLGDDDVVEHLSVGGELDDTHVFLDGVLNALEADVADFYSLGVIRHGEAEFAVVVGDCGDIGSGHCY